MIVFFKVLTYHQRSAIAPVISRKISASSHTSINKSVPSPLPLFTTKLCFCVNRLPKIFNKILLFCYKIKQIIQKNKK